MKFLRWLFGNKTVYHTANISFAMPPPIKRDPYEEFDDERAAYLKDNGYLELDRQTMLKYLERNPYWDTVYLREKDLRFYRRIQGEIFLYSGSYLREKTYEELRAGAARMTGMKESICACQYLNPKPLVSCLYGAHRRLKPYDCYLYRYSKRQYDPLIEGE